MACLSGNLGDVRAGRLLELLLLLQLRGRTTVPELAAELEVSVRTVHRDLAALSGAGVPVYAERGRGGGVRLLEGYRVGGVGPLDDSEARAVVLAGAPSVAADLGLDVRAGDKLFSAMEAAAASAARSLTERLLVEPEGWFTSRSDTPYLLVVAKAVWESRELAVDYEGASSGSSHRVVRPLGLISKAGTWYLMARTRAGSEDRLYRLSRVREARLLDHRFSRPDDFDLAASWKARKEAFAASIPTYLVTVRLAPEGEPLLRWLQEGTPSLPLTADMARDRAGWATLDLRFERPDSAARHLATLGPLVEVLEPAELRHMVANAAYETANLYRERRAPPKRRPVSRTQ